MYNQKKERESAKSSPCKSLKETPTTATIFKQSSRTTRKPPNRKFFLMESDMTQEYFHRTPGAPATLPPKKTFDYFLERATRYEGDHVSKPAKYCFSARSVYNELVLALPEFGAYQLSYYLRQKFDLEHQVRLHVPAFDPHWECIFIGEHSKLSLAEEVAFRGFFIYVAMTITTDAIRKTKPWTPDPSPFFQRKKTYDEQEAEDIERENYENMLAEELGSVSLQSGLQGAVGASESSTSETQNTQLVTVGEAEEIEPYPDEPSERTLSEQPFTDLNLAGVAWWLNKVTWSTTSQIQVFDLYNIMFNDVSANAAIVKSFQVHAISKLTARVTIKPNAVNFNVGLMGVTFVPLWNMWTPEDQKLWLNKFSLTQLPFTMINACSNNEVVVPINFAYPLNYVPHISSPNYLPQRSLGALIYFPIVNLAIGDQGTRTCDLNAFIHFDSVEFVGKIDQRVNMQSGLFGKVGETLHAGLSLMNGNPDPTFNMLNKVAKSLINNKNADHPINPSPGQFVIPQALPSQSSVTNIENPVNSFRMDPLGTVTHNFPPTESFEELVHRPGLFRQVTITSADSPKLLTSWTNQPLKPYNDYVPYATDPNRRHVPPVGVIASIFENAKGSSVYEVYAAMTDKHNFKLMFGVLPTPISPTQPIDLTYLRNSKFTELNYTNGKFTNEVVAPYFNPKTWIRIPSNAYVNSDCQTASYTPSYCYLYLMTTLSYATGVPSSVTLSIFERAGPDFELSVVKSPSLSVQPYSNPNTYPGLKLAGYHWASDLTFTFSTLAPGGKPASADWIWNMWFTNPTSNFRAVLLYYGDTPTSGPSIPGYGNRRHAVGYVPLNQPDTSVLLVSVLDSTAAPVAAVYTAIRNFSNNYTQPTFDALAPFLVSTEMTNAFTYGPTYAFHVLWTPNNPIPTVSKQMGYTGLTTTDVDSPFPSTTMRGWGKKDFGEDFSSITNVLKRPYGDINIGIETARSASYPNAAFRVNVSPALPRTTPPPINSLDYVYSASAADIVLKGFIGFKGSVIMHALFPTVQNASVWTNYFPDAFPSRDIVQYPTATNNQRLVSTAPKQTFNLGINSAIRTAIPYYNPSEFIFTWSTLGKQGDNALVNSMGSVTYGLDVNRTSDLPATLRAVVMRSFGDDAALYFFRGFPPVVFFAEHPPVIARNSSMADIEENPGPIFSRFVHKTAETAGEGFSQGIFHGVETYFSELATNLEGLVKTKLAEKGVVSTPDFSLSNILTVLFQESGHCILNPSWKTFLWSFGIVLQRLGILGLQGAAKVFAALTAWLAEMAAASSQPSTGAVSLQGNQPDPDPHPIEFITILITGIATLFGIKEWKDSGNRTAKEFTATFKAALQMGTTLNAFMKATRGAFKAIFQKAYFWYISEKPDAASVKAIAVTDSLIANWMKEVDFLTDRSIRESVNTDPSLQLRVRVAYIVGRRLHAQLILANDRKTSPLVYYFNLIKKLYEDFAVNGFASHIRKEPWVIYVHGKTCIGKSQLQSDLCSRLLRAENIVVDGAMTYNVPTISPFMTDLRKQKVIAVDDIMSVVLPESLRTWLSLIFENATCASFKPNKPAIEDKDMEVENEILYINSNFEFIEHDSIPDKNAFHRRFHFKIEAALTDELVDARHETAKTVPKSILEKFEHLKFRRTLNPWNVLAPRYTDWMTYPDLIEMAIADFRAWRIAAQESVNRRMLCELQAKSLGLNNITYEDLQNDSFVEDKIREYLETLDAMDNERGIFSYDFRKLLSPHTLTLKETFNKFYAKVETPVTEMLKKLTSWTMSEGSSVSLQGPPIRTSCEEILSMHKVLTGLWECCEFAPGETEKLKDMVIGYFAPAALKYPHHAFVRAIRTCELAKGLHISKCRCEEEALDANLFCEETKCFVKIYAIHKKSLQTFASRIKDWNTLAISKLKSFYETIWSSMNPILKGTLVLIGIVATGAVFKLVFNWLTAKWNGDKDGIDKDFRKTFMFQSGHYSPGTSSKEAKKSSQTKTNVTSFTSRAVTLQSGNFEDVVTKVRRNLRWITVCPEAEATNPNFERMLFPILGVHDRTYLVILHYIQTITKALTQSDVKYIATLYDGHIHVPLSMNDFCESLLKWRCNEESLSELGVWEAPARTHLVANILTHCGSRSKLARMNNECFIVPCFTDLTSPCVLTRFNNFNSKYYDVSEYNHLVAYDGYSKPGFCGSLVFSKNLSTLVAIHTMGSDDGKIGFGELVFREDLEAENIVEPGYENIELEALSPEEIRNFPQYLKMLGKIPDYQVKKQGNKTVFVPSPLANTVFEVRKEPAPLSSSDERVNYDWSPMKEGVKKHSNPPKGFERELLLASAQATKELLQQSCPPPRNQVGILSIDEAVIGIPELKFKPLDMSTSPGFPLNVIRQRNQSGKAFLFHLEQTNNERKLLGLHPELRRILSYEEHQRSQGIACFSPAIDCLKDELLKIEKARRIGGTRVFSTSPVQQVIAGKRLMGDWLMSYRSNWILSEHAISINPLSNDWMQLAQRLKTFPNILEGDYSGFGPQADSDVAQAAITNIIEWYEFNDASFAHLTQLRALREELVNGIHICNNYVYSTISGIISGSFATAEINSEINKIYTRIAWLGTTNTDLATFDANVVLYTYGDDVIMSVSDKYIEQFNIRTISEFLAGHNIKFTNASKSSEIIEKVTLKEATFLKRSFRFDPTVPNQCLAPLDKVSIEEQLNWVRNTQDPWDLMVASVDSMMIEAAMWGQSYYDEIRSKVNTAFARNQKRYCFVDYRTMIKKIYEKESS